MRRSSSSFDLSGVDKPLVNAIRSRSIAHIGEHLRNIEVRVVTGRGDEYPFSYPPEPEIPKKASADQATSDYLKEKAKTKRKEERNLLLKSLGILILDFFALFGKYILRFLLVIIWLWAMKSVLNIYESDVKFNDKMHACIPRTVRLPEYLYYESNETAEEVSLMMDIVGPFIPLEEQTKDYDDDKLDAKKAIVFKCAIERWSYDKGYTNKKVESIGDSTSSARLVMINRTGFAHLEPLDYNNYPRNIRINIGMNKKPIEKGRIMKYAVGFGADEAQEFPIPFSFSYSVDPIPIRLRLRYGLLPPAVFGVMCLCLVSRFTAAYIASAMTAISYLKTGNVIESVNIIIKWMDVDVIVYHFTVMLFVSLMVETRIHSFFAFKLLKLVHKKGFLYSVIAINVLSFVLCIFVNNILIALMLTPFVIRIMETLELDPRPVLINMAMMCNIGGRTYVGTFASKAAVLQGDLNIFKITMTKIFGFMILYTTLAAVVTFGYFFLIYHYLQPQVPQKRYEYVEKEHMTLLWNRAIVVVPEVSLAWGKVIEKMKEMTEKLRLEAEEIRYRNLPRGSWYRRMLENAPEYKIHNNFLLFKVTLVLICFLGLLSPWVYDIKIKKLSTHGEMRLGTISLFISLLLLLIVHARDFELMLKRVDWQSLGVVAAWGIFVKVFLEITLDLHEYIWKKYGPSMKGTKKQKLTSIVSQIMSYSSLTAIFNEYVVFNTFLKTVKRFAQSDGLDSVSDVFGGFHLATGICWGGTTIIAAFPNLLVIGAAEQQGYRIAFYTYLVYGLPISIILFLVSLVVKLLLI